MSGGYPIDPQLAAALEEAMTISASRALVEDDTRPDIGSVAVLTMAPTVTVHTSDDRPGAEVVDVVASALPGMASPWSPRSSQPSLLRSRCCPIGDPLSTRPATNWRSTSRARCSTTTTSAAHRPDGRQNLQPRAARGAGRQHPPLEKGDRYGQLTATIPGQDSCGERGGTVRRCARSIPHTPRNGAESVASTSARTQARRQARARLAAKIAERRRREQAELERITDFEAALTRRDLAEIEMAAAVAGLLDLGNSVADAASLTQQPETEIRRLHKLAARAASTVAEDSIDGFPPAVPSAGDQESEGENIADVGYDAVGTAAGISGEAGFVASACEDGSSAEPGAAR
jgi:hypothetical protein